MIEHKLKENTYQNHKGIIFTYAKSVLQALDSQKYKFHAITDLSNILDNFIRAYD